MAALETEVVEERVDAQVAIGAGELTASRPAAGRTATAGARTARFCCARSSPGEQDVGYVVSGEAAARSSTSDIGAAARR